MDVLSTTCKTVGILTTHGWTEVLKGSYEVDSQGNERYLAPDGNSVIEFKDSSILARRFEE
jgi:hypothetical protein